MSLITYDFDLPVTPGAIPPILKLSQYDDARTYVAHLKDDTGEEFDLPEGSTATLEGVNCKGVAFEIEAGISAAPITYTKSLITFTPAEAATDQPGKIRASLCIKSGSEQLTPLLVILDVQRAGATKEEVARSPGFTDAIDETVDKYLDDHQPFFTLPEGGEAGQALVSDGNGGASWATIEGGADLPNGDEVSY